MILPQKKVEIKSLTGFKVPVLSYTHIIIIFLNSHILINLLLSGIPGTRINSPAIINFKWASSKTSDLSMERLNKES